MMALIPGFNEQEEKVFHTEVGHCLISAKVFEISGKTVEGKRVLKITSVGKVTLDCDEISMKMDQLVMEISMKEKSSDG